MLLDVAPRRGAANSKIIYGNTTARATQVTGSDKFLTTGGLPGTGVTAPWQIEPLVLIVNGWLQDRRRERQLHILQEGTSGDTNTGTAVLPPRRLANDPTIHTECPNKFSVCFSLDLDLAVLPPDAWELFHASHHPYRMPQRIFCVLLARPALGSASP
ncbi:hypothetical protein Vretimale_7056 [Volvox reticuliferus]|uniref:Uncharacterized protein n=1 Tax=Volvox reticuliferus TaxID=1737510 RepID=A0A8J4G8R5_9CHLO|nr:hypothetical protein Vretimale_7056 [Volvox reticuliferus]